MGKKKKTAAVQSTPGPANSTPPPTAQTSLEDQIKKLTEEKEALKKELDTTTSLIGELRHQLQSKTEEHEKVVSENASLKQKAGALETELAHVGEALLKTQETLKAKSKEVEALQKKKEALTEQTAQAEIKQPAPPLSSKAEEKKPIEERTHEIPISIEEQDSAEFEVLSASSYRIESKALSLSEQEELEALRQKTTLQEEQLAASQQALSLLQSQKSDGSEAKASEKQSAFPTLALIEAQLQAKGILSKITQATDQYIDTIKKEGPGRETGLKRAYAIKAAINMRSPKHPYSAVILTLACFSTTNSPTLHQFIRNAFKELKWKDILEQTGTVASTVGKLTSSLSQTQVFKTACSYFRQNQYTKTSVVEFKTPDYQTLYKLFMAVCDKLLGISRLNMEDVYHLIGRPHDQRTQERACLQDIQKLTDLMVNKPGSFLALLHQEDYKKVSLPGSITDITQRENLTESKRQALLDQYLENLGELRSATPNTPAP